MSFFCFAYLVLKVWIILHANGIYRSIHDCYEYTRVDPVLSTNGMLLDAISAQRDIARAAAMLSVVAALVTIIISMYHISLSSSRMRRESDVVYTDWWTLVSKPIIVTILGAVVLIVDALMVGAYAYSHPLSTIDHINETIEPRSCVRRGRVGTLIILAVSSLLTYALIVISGHYTGLRKRFVRQNPSAHHGRHHQLDNYRDEL
jgi:Mn2+/Fe2+ NRAMP family transporter